MTRTELASRVGQSATNLSRLIDPGDVRRDVPFGENIQSARRGLYRLDDPFLLLWYRLVAPNPGTLARIRQPARDTGSRTMGSAEPQ